MHSDYNTLAHHEELLADKGYLSEEFKAGHKVGYWVHELKERFALSEFNAIGESKIDYFSIEATAAFNARLDLVQFRFFYEYDPENQSLSLNSIQAKLGNIHKSFIVTESNPLPDASEVYSTLIKKASQNKTYDRFYRMERAIKRRGQSF